ncbi:hypothetical protein G6F35_016584 [Rhizopus arrhizus]|nr:hypothetical protein G6F35_016584 [Rhizopus arrhizus]
MRAQHHPGHQEHDRQRLQHVSNTIIWPDRGNHRHAGADRPEAAPLCRRVAAGVADEGHRHQQQGQATGGDARHSDQSWLDRSGRRASQRLLPIEYSAHENNAPNAHNRPIRRCRQGVARCSDISASQPTSATPSTHRPSAGNSCFSGTAPFSRTPTRVTTTGIRPTMSEAAAPPAHCTAVASSRK